MEKNTILVLGASGMLGNAIAKYLSLDDKNNVFGTIRNLNSLKFFPKTSRVKLKLGVNIENFDELIDLINEVRPTIVINCIGIIKQIKSAEDPIKVLPINSIFPHRLANLCSLVGARLIHFSTDCVFSGSKGNYSESDKSDCYDLYGISKHLGEVTQNNCITIRTSIIGHELNSSNSLVNWFLNQEGIVYGYKKAIFSGLPTVEIARILHTYVLPNKEIQGLYHVSSNPISKLDLLELIKNKYGKEIEIIPNEALSINRSLNSTKFQNLTGYSPRNWNDLINFMHEFEFEKIKNIQTLQRC